MATSWIRGDFNVDLDNFWEGKHSSFGQVANGNNRSFVPIFSPLFGRVLIWQGNVAPSSCLNIVLLSINLRKIVQFTQNYFDVQMGPSGKDVFRRKISRFEQFWFEQIWTIRIVTYSPWLNQQKEKIKLMKEPWKAHPQRNLLGGGTGRILKQKTMYEICMKQVFCASHSISRVVKFRRK